MKTILLILSILLLSISVSKAQNTNTKKDIYIVDQGGTDKKWGNLNIKALYDEMKQSRVGDRVYSIPESEYIELANKGQLPLAFFFLSACTSDGICLVSMHQYKYTRNFLYTCCGCHLDTKQDLDVVIELRNFILRNVD